MGLIGVALVVLATACSSDPPAATDSPIPSVVNPVTSSSSSTKPPPVTAPLPVSDGPIRFATQIVDVGESVGGGDGVLRIGGDCVTIERDNDDRGEELLFPPRRSFWDESIESIVLDGRAYRDGDLIGLGAMGDGEEKFWPPNGADECGDRSIRLVVVEIEEARRGNGEPIGPIVFANSSFDRDTVEVDVRSGTLRLEGECATFEVEGSDLVIGLVFPLERTLWDGSTSSILLDGRAYRDGDNIEGLGVMGDGKGPLLPRYDYFECVHPSLREVVVFIR